MISFPLSNLHSAHFKVIKPPTPSAVIQTGKIIPRGKTKMNASCRSTSMKWIRMQKMFFLLVVEFARTTGPDRQQNPRQCPAVHEKVVHVLQKKLKWEISVGVIDDRRATNLGSVKFRCSPHGCTRRMPEALAPEQSRGFETVVSLLTLCAWEVSSRLKRLEQDLTSGENLKNKEPVWQGHRHMPRNQG